MIVPGWSAGCSFHVKSSLHRSCISKFMTQTLKIYQIDKITGTLIRQFKRD
ncbi:hypothetical protein CHCC20375_2856 [Bacillus licheniformis]|nr:hypothetical protein CHCC20375_2856 [Bacillus licheniformis]